MVEIDEMICVDSSGDWERTLAFQAFSEWTFKSRTDRAATMLILGRVCASFDMGRPRAVPELPVLGEATREECKMSRRRHRRKTPRLTNDDTRGDGG